MLVTHYNREKKPCIFNENHSLKLYGKYLKPDFGRQKKEERNQYYNLNI